MTLTILIAFLSSGLTYFGATYFNNKKKNTVVADTTILLEKIKAVSKLITVESSFSEIVEIRDSKKLILGFTSDKKILIISKAKVFVGIDLTKCSFTTNKDTKTLSINFIPLPEIIALENDINFYHTEQGLFNKLTSQDYTQAKKIADEKIKEIVSQSNLLTLAQTQAQNTISIFKHITETSGWTFNLTDENYSQKQIE